MPEELKTPVNEQKPDEAATPPEGGAPGTKPEDDGKPKTSNGKPFALTKDGKSLGYPADTAVAEMSAEEGREYWKAMSRKHEARENEAVHPDEHARVLAELEELRTAGQTAEQQQATQALTAAKDEGFKEAEEFFRPLLNGVQLESYATTVIGLEKAREWATTVNTDSFKGDDGFIDGSKVQTYLKNLFGDPKAGDGTPAPRTPAPGTYPNSGQYQTPRKPVPDRAAQVAEQLARQGVKPSA